MFCQISLNTGFSYKRYYWCPAVRVVTFKITYELLELVDSYARSIKRSRSEVIRTALIEYLKANYPDFEKELQKRKLERKKITWLLI